MDRRHFLAASGAAALLPALAKAQAAASRTRWIVRPSEAYDAVAFLASLSGDSFYARFYEAEVAEFGARLPAATMTAIRELREDVARRDGLMWPSFTLFLSAGPDRTIDDFLGSMEDPDRMLKPGFRASPYWNEDNEAAEEASWSRFVGRLPVLRSVLTAMAQAGFRDYRTRLFDAAAATRLPQVRERLASVDVISELERFTGRGFDPTIEVVMMYFNKPHGVKVIGQKFLTGIDYDDNITIGTAAHELLHPPVNMSGPAAAAALEVLGRDDLFRRILAERDRRFGYGTLQGLMDEDLAEAVDQLIAERLGIATGMRNASTRWQDHDGGMHVLAAGFYTLLKRSGFAETGGNLEHWLHRMALGGWLAPPSLHGAAAETMGYRADRLWPPPARPARRG